MRKYVPFVMAAVLLLGARPAWLLPAAFADQTEETAAGQVAGEEEKASRSKVGKEGMEPVYADALLPGVYPVEVDTDTSMFRAEEAELTVADGAMSAVMTMGGKGYLYLFMGTGEEALAADPSSYIPFEEDAEGRHTFTVPVEALDKPIVCTAYSKRKEKWYDHEILFEAESLPETAFPKVSEAMTPAEPAKTDLADGAYTIGVSMTGGSGKASVTSPAEMTVTGGEALVNLEWSSPNYDYMIVGGEKYLPVNETGNSVFAIPVLAFDAPVTVLADTTVMSKPHEIEYQLTFDGNSAAAVKKSPGTTGFAGIAAALCIAGAILLSLAFRRRNRR